LLPSEWAPASAEVAGQTASMLLVTVHPEHVSPAALRLVNALVIAGKQPRQAAEEFARVIGKPAPEMSDRDLAPGEAAVWFVDSDRVVNKIQTEPGKADRKRHKRKYAEGELEPERIFYFRGPQNKSNLRVQNLAIFVQLAEGIDDETWMFHLKQSDYSNWFATSIKDKELAAEIETIERDHSLSPQESRSRVAKAIEDKYTAPA
ncbi:MAG: phosphoglycolate phosphatase, partial [Acidobacteriota bacterium]|nr:phosphoglycolate phosphatase [Acidobacteriota bacterium]